MNILVREGKTNLKYILIVLILAILIGGGSLWLAKNQEMIPLELLEINNLEKNNKIDIPECCSNNNQFRNLIIYFLREVAESYFSKKPLQYPEKLEIEDDWEISITIYHQGEIKGEGKGENEILSLALEETVKTALSDERAKSLTSEELENLRFLIKFLNPPDHFSFIEYNREGKELIGDLVVIRDLDKDLISQKIEEGKEFLYRMMDEDEKGFHKYYYALNDSFENRLHTVYSASIIYTFLYIYDLEKDEKILANTADWGNFLLSMQNKDKEDKRYGAFHYSYFLDSQEKEKKFVVGTAALSIFTLLRLYELTDELKYLESAKLAGDWLTTMQEPDGQMKPYVRYSEDKWVYGKNESLLYEGQVLSALSKLYQVTGNKKYYDTAEGIAKRFADKYEKEQGFIEGEYRKKNPISNSWVVMSLTDFYRVNQDEYYKKIIFELSEKVLEKQKDDPSDLLHYGSWWSVYSTSGVGWISEVMVETYRFCREQNYEDCEKYKDAAIKAMRLLIQNTYSRENTFFLGNPDRAIGGVFWNENNKYVRTDSVCHALNGYARIMDYLEKGLLLSIPEKTFEETLNDFLEN